MPIMNPVAGVKSVAEITSGQSNERSADGGQLADVSVRTWRLVLSAPGAGYDIQAAVGVYIGDRHPANTALPCVSISERPDGESRVVRTVTATYRTTPGSDSNPQNDPNTQPPDVRPATFTISSSLIEVPATKWREIFVGAGAEKDPLNPAKDRYDGVSKLVPMITISLEQFDNSPTARLDDSGKVNSDDIEFLGLPVPRFTCMLRGINVRPTVEAFGDLTYRGFTRTFEFAIRQDGWWIDQILEGFNIINQGLGVAAVWQDGLVLEHKDGKVREPPAGATALVKPGSKVRAVVPIYSPDGGWMQRPSAQPVALNENGTPRDVETQDPPVLTKRYITQPVVAFGNNFVNIGVRVADII